MLERVVRDMGGHIAAMDTDSAMIVSTKDGGLVPCAGGPHKLVEAAGVELFSVLTARKLLILRMARGAKKAPLPDSLYVYCTMRVSVLRRRIQNPRTEVAVSL